MIASEKNSSIFFLADGAGNECSADRFINRLKSFTWEICPGIFIIFLYNPFLVFWLFDKKIKVKVKVGKFFF